MEHGWMRRLVCNILGKAQGSLNEDEVKDPDRLALPLFSFRKELWIISETT